MAAGASATWQVWTALRRWASILVVAVSNSLEKTYRSGIQGILGTFDVSDSLDVVDVL